MGTLPIIHPLWHTCSGRYTLILHNAYNAYNGIVGSYCVCYMVRTRSIIHIGCMYLHIHVMGASPDRRIYTLYRQYDITCISQDADIPLSRDIGIPSLRIYTPHTRQQIPCVWDGTPNGVGQHLVIQQYICTLRVRSIIHNGTDGISLIHGNY